LVVEEVAVANLVVVEVLVPTSLDQIPLHLLIIQLLQLVVEVKQVSVEILLPRMVVNRAVRQK